MTDKKEIMIDGVDVLYICKYGQTGLPICVDLEHRYCKLKSTNSKKCNLRPVVEYSDYEKLYKQLQHKTAECEELNTKYTEVVNLAKQNADANEYCLRDLEEENAKLKTECGELKNKERKLYNFLKNPYNWSHKDVWIRNYLLHYLFGEREHTACTADILENKLQKYKQALEEVEGKIKEINGSDVLTFPDLSLQENAKAIMRQCNKGYREILDIIRKAKGEE